MLIYNHNNETLQLFNHEERIGVGLWTKESSLVQCIKWSSYLNTFLILSTQTLHSLDCSQQPFHITPISQVKKSKDQSSVFDIDFLDHSITWNPNEIFECIA